MWLTWFCFAKLSGRDRKKNKKQKWATVEMAYLQNLKNMMPEIASSEFDFFPWILDRASRKMWQSWEGKMDNFFKTFYVYSTQVTFSRILCRFVVVLGFLLFWPETHCVAQGGIKVVILLPQFSKNGIHQGATHKRILGIVLHINFLNVHFIKTFITRAKL